MMSEKVLVGWGACMVEWTCYAIGQDKKGDRASAAQKPDEGDGDDG